MTFLDFKVLQNRYGNKPTVVLIEDLERFAPVRSYQPRKVIDPIQTIEKALNSLIELEKLKSSRMFW